MSSLIKGSGDFTFQSKLCEVLVILNQSLFVTTYFSERAKQTEAKGERFEEAKNINKSLLTLGNVIESEWT